MKLNSVLNKFRKNGLEFKQVNDSPVYVCKHDLVKNTYVRVLAQADGETVASMAIVYEYKSGDEATYFRTISSLFDKFIGKVERVERRREQLLKQAEKQAVDVAEVAADVKIDRELFRVERESVSLYKEQVTIYYNDVEVKSFTEYNFGDSADDALITRLLECPTPKLKAAVAAAPAQTFDDEKFLVERKRPTITQGSVTVYYDGVEVAQYGDEIDLIEDGEPYHGEMFQGWASRISDGSFIDTVKRRPGKELLALVEPAPLAAADGFMLQQRADQAYVYYRNELLMIAANDGSRKGEDFFGIAQALFSDKIAAIELERQVPELVELQPESTTIDIEKFELKREYDELHVYYDDVYITTYEITGEVTVSYYINMTVSIYRSILERIEKDRAATGCVSLVN